jgi:hypothetical protein
MGERLVPAGVGYEQADLPNPPSQREAWSGRWRGLECV